jgi:hypothetical protein
MVVSGSRDGRARPAGSTLELSGHNLDKRVRSDHPLRRINAALTIDISRDAQQDPGLGDRTRTKNENVDQSFCALRPIRPGCHVGYGIARAVYAPGLYIREASKPNWTVTWTRPEYQRSSSS